MLHQFVAEFDFGDQPNKVHKNSGDEAPKAVECRSKQTLRLTVQLIRSDPKRSYMYIADELVY